SRTIAAGDDLDVHLVLRHSVAEYRALHAAEALREYVHRDDVTLNLDAADADTGPGGEWVLGFHADVARGHVCERVRPDRSGASRRGLADHAAAGDERDAAERDGGHAVRHQETALHGPRARH